MSKVQYFSLELEFMFANILALLETGIFVSGGKKILRKMTDEAILITQEKSHDPNPFNSRLYSIDDLNEVWTTVKTRQTTKAFYGHNQQRAPDSWLFSNFAKHKRLSFR